MKIGIYDMATCKIVGRYDPIENWDVDNYDATLELQRKLNEAKENKMTREEAKNKLIAIGNPGVDTALDTLEALGLIKFEEKKLTKLEYVADQLNRACYERFGNKWSDDQAKAFAEVAIRASYDYYS